MASPLRASKVVPIATARANLAKLVREARGAEGPVALITQRGKPVGPGPVADSSCGVMRAFLITSATFSRRSARHTRVSRR